MVNFHMRALGIRAGIYFRNRIDLEAFLQWLSATGRVTRIGAELAYEHLPLRIATADEWAQFERDAACDIATMIA